MSLKTNRSLNGIVRWFYKLTVEQRTMQRAHGSPKQKRTNPSTHSQNKKWQITGDKMSFEKRRTRPGVEITPLGAGTFRTYRFQWGRCGCWPSGPHDDFAVFRVVLYANGKLDANTTVRRLFTISNRFIQYVWNWLCGRIYIMHFVFWHFLNGFVMTGWLCVPEREYMNFYFVPIMLIKCINISNKDCLCLCMETFVFEYFSRTVKEMDSFW